MEKILHTVEDPIVEELLKIIEYLIVIRIQHNINIIL